MYCFILVLLSMSRDWFSLAHTLGSSVSDPAFWWSWCLRFSDHFCSRFMLLRCYCILLKIRFGSVVLRCLPRSPSLICRILAFHVVNTGSGEVEQ